MLWQSNCDSYVDVKLAEFQLGGPLKYNLYKLYESCENDLSFVLKVDKVFKAGPGCYYHMYKPGSSCNYHIYKLSGSNPKVRSDSARQLCISQYLARL